MKKLIGKNLRSVARFFLMAACVAALGVPVVPFTSSVRAQVRPVYSAGAAGLVQLLKRLQTTASAMHTGAHPDDEDSALIARLARGDQARVVYLALNRGEGGQNVIGPDLFEPLGIIRTEELLQARRLDGGEQMFTRTFDYGFSKTRQEAASKWGERVVLGDMVAAIRRFRPLVVIARFTGTPADGHGQHQLSGYLTPIAFKAAADPNEFPEQIAQGLRPWQARKLYVSEGFQASADNEPSLRVPTGTLDPLFGRSYYEIAMEGRSQHKSQEMGMLELRGPKVSGVRRLQSLVTAAESERSVFDGIDTSLQGISRLVGLDPDPIGEELGAARNAAARALAEFDPLSPVKLVGPLAEGLKAVRAARTKLQSVTGGPAADADFLLEQKEREFTNALLRAAGVTIDALADRETVAPGESLVATVKAFLSDGSPATVSALSLRLPEGWKSEPTEEPKPVGRPFARRFMTETAAQTAAFKVTVPATAAPSQPYWLEAPREGYLYTWPATAPQGQPFAPESARGEMTVTVAGMTVAVSQPIQFRFADAVQGELRRNLDVVPEVSVALDTNLHIVPTATQSTTRRVAVRLANNTQAGVTGTARLALPAGWSAQPAESPFTLKANGERTAVVFTVTIPGNTKAEAYTIGALATVNGKTYTREMRTVAYPHIQTHRYYTTAEATVRVLDLKTVPVKVGYVMGSGDKVPDAIRRMGLDVTLLTADDLSTGDLNAYDTIVIGIRASQVRPDFVANNGRLLEFVNRGGTLIVQYQQQEYLDNNLAPFPAQMASRVTDETAQVSVLQPKHPAFNFPNKIGDDDWKGWVQERTLYNFTTFDPKYTPLLECHDPNELEQTGGELYAEIGRGRYVYTSYAWFRQLPTGVPGAYRLFANLLALGKSGGTAKPSAKPTTKR